MPTRKLTTLQYQLRVYGGLRAASRRYSPAHDMAQSPFPRWIQLQTINACQAACRMCPYPVYKDIFPRGRMDDALFAKIITEIAAHPEVEAFIPMLQNEPLLDKRLFDRIAGFRARASGRTTVELVTNGALLTDEAVSNIRDVRLDVLDISLDAATRETFERIRVGLRWDDVIAGVERVLAADLPHTSVVVRLVRQKENAGEAKAFARRWRRRGVAVFVYDVTNRVGAVPDFDERVRLPASNDSPLRRAGRRVARAWIGGHCPIPFASAYILHSGEMLLCAHDWDRREILGNLRDHTIAELWNGERMREIRSLVSQRKYEQVAGCRDCSLWRDGWF